jgi:hypothetical protein
MSVKPAVGKAGVTHDLGYTDLSNTTSPEFLCGSLDDTGAGVAFMFFRPWHVRVTPAKNSFDDTS